MLTPWPLVAAVAASCSSTSAPGAAVSETAVAEAVRLASKSDKLCEMLRHCVLNDSWTKDCVLWVPEELGQCGRRRRVSAC